MQICQTTCFCYCISKIKNEFGQNPNENIILIGAGPYTKLLTGQYTKILTGCANKNKYQNNYALVLLFFHYERKYDYRPKEYAKIFFGIFLVKLIMMYRYMYGLRCQ